MSHIEVNDVTDKEDSNKSRMKKNVLQMETETESKT